MRRVALQVADSTAECALQSRDQWSRSDATAPSRAHRDHLSRLYNLPLCAVRMLIAVALLLALTGCKTWVPDRTLQNAVDRGDFAAARDLVNAKLTQNPALRTYVEERLAGDVRAPDRTPRRGW